MNLNCIESDQEFLALRREWDAMLQASSSDCVFLTHEWLSAWWSHLAGGRRLCILTARDNGRLIGILPLAETRPQYSRMMPRMLELLGSGIIGSDYLDAIIMRGREPEVLDGFAAELSRRGPILHLSQLRRGKSLLSGLAGRLRDHAWTAAEVKQNVCPYIDLRGHTWESYLASIGSNLRKNIGRYLRNLPKTFHMQVECVQSPAEAQRALDHVMDLHQKRWAMGARRSEAFQTGPVVAFHRQFVQLAAERGWLRLLVLWLDGRPAAALYGLRYGSTFYFYQSGFDPAYSRHSVGVATMGLSIKTAIEEGALEYDFLHGDEEYKFHWASGTREIGRLELYPPYARARIYRRAIDLNRLARRMARRVLNTAYNHASLNR